MNKKDKRSRKTARAVQNALLRLLCEHRIDEIMLIESGSPEEWFRETADLCASIYAETPEGTNVSYDYVAKFTPLVEQQFLRGGYRLAMLLNEIYK